MILHHVFRFPGRAHRGRGGTPRGAGHFRDGGDGWPRCPRHTILLRLGQPRLWGTGIPGADPRLWRQHECSDGRELAGRGSRSQAFDALAAAAGVGFACVRLPRRKRPCRQRSAAPTLAFDFVLNTLLGFMFAYIDRSIPKLRSTRGECLLAVFCVLAFVVSPISPLSWRSREGLVLIFPPGIFIYYFLFQLLLFSINPHIHYYLSPNGVCFVDDDVGHLLGVW